MNLISGYERDASMDARVDHNANILLKALLQSYFENVKKELNSHGSRYTSETKFFAIYMFLVSGPLAYQTLRANLTYCMPATNSVRAYIHKHTRESNIREGVLRCQELRDYLDKNDLPLVVSLSEDATRIINRIQYDSSTNQLIGFTLPVNKCGMPSCDAFMARSAFEIEQNFLLNSDNVSSFVNVIMAQPLRQGYSPFCLLMFGSNNKYSAMDVVKRWLFIKHELNKVGIEVLVVSSDSDSKYNAAMRFLSKLGTPSTRLEGANWFVCKRGSVRK